MTANEIFEARRKLAIVMLNCSKSEQGQLRKQWRNLLPLPSEPVHIGVILPDVMACIEQRIATEVCV